MVDHSRYYKEETLKNYNKRIKDLDVPESDKEVVFNLKKEAEASGLSTSRVLFYIKRCYRLLQFKDKSFKEMDKEDVKELVRKLENGEITKEEGGEYGAWSKQAYKTTLRKIFQLLGGYEWKSKEWPKKVDWISSTVSNNEKKYEVLNEEEIKKLIRSADKVRDKAFIMGLYESGVRIGEYLDLEIKDLDFNEHGVKLIVDGKTGVRKILLVSASPHLSNWLEHHPKGDKREAPLWTNYRGNKLGYNGARRVINKASEKAGIDKPVNPHNFRHSRATHLANELTEAQMCEYFGWVQGSDQPATYVHLSGRDVDNAILNVYGIKTDEKESNGDKLKTKSCPRCEKKLSPEAEFCNRCGAPLTKEAKRKRMEKEIEEKKEEFDREEFKSEIIQELKSEFKE